MIRREIQSQYFLGRQPIFTQKLDLFAYELLFRNNTYNYAAINGSNGDTATSHVIYNTFLELGSDRVLHDKKGFINLTREFIVGDILLPFSPKQVVLEVLENIDIDDSVMTGIKRLADSGYTIALDDFIYQPKLEPFLQYASIVKIDILCFTAKELEEHVRLLRQRPLRLLAEKVETREQFLHCQQLGFDYFQGYFFCEPIIITDKRLPTNKLTAIDILKKLQHNSTTIEDIEQSLKRDLSLSYKLLRYLNSASFALPQKIDCLKQAVIFLGLDTIRAWSTIILLSNINNNVTDELLTTGLVRAKMSEIMSPQFSCNSQTAFMLGLFSIADAMFNQSMSTLLNALPISDALKSALESGEGSLGQLLSFIKKVETGLVFSPPQFINAEQVNQAFFSATDWAYQTRKEIRAVA